MESVIDFICDHLLIGFTVTAEIRKKKQSKSKNLKNTYIHKGRKNLLSAGHRFGGYCSETGVHCVKIFCPLHFLHAD